MLARRTGDDLDTPTTVGRSAASLARRPRWPGVLAWVGWVLATLGLVLVVWFNDLLRRGGLVDVGSNADSGVFGLAAVSAATVGAVLAGRRPRHPVGWLLLGLALWLIYGYAGWAVLAWRGASDAFGSAVKDISVLVMTAFIGFILLLTPTGSLPSPAWRWWARVARSTTVVLDPPLSRLRPSGSRRRARRRTALVRSANGIAGSGRGRRRRRRTSRRP